MVNCRIALAVALLFSDVPGLAAQTRWTDPPTRTAAPSETNAPAQPVAEQPKGHASRRAVRRQAKRPPARNRAVATVRRPPRLVVQQPSPPVLRSHRAERVSRPMPHQRTVLVRRTHPVVVSRPVPHRRTVLVRRPYPAVGIGEVDPWTIRVHPWAGDLDCSGPNAFGVRRGLCPWMPARNPGDEE
ncbi:hypothetical protein Mnod_2690 [Methylobacterium nodulans ORS 2060]|uniref:Uncharacterized protein n=1 Tax=Methylobacterium nodulans (strain LMG 21967 / CNCM I-2342 / ORS 2060) TaxID=460265 RepID=B8IEA2_METNO|nr:hypothetical protein Mnod_2690 [Methylobacterium nodulans ORS 2060]